MRALSDIMLASGSTYHVEVIHGEVITVLDGALAGQTFMAIVEVESDQIISTDMGEDRRQRVFLRFRDDGNVPNLISQTRIKTADGLIWTAIRSPQDGYLTTDFELQAITNQDH